MKVANFIDKNQEFHNEPDVQYYAKSLLESEVFGYQVFQHKTGDAEFDRSFPSKSSEDGRGSPDLLLKAEGDKYPVCVWENKEMGVPVSKALGEAKFYIQGLHLAMSGTPGLPRVAAGFNGKELALEFLSNENKWLKVKLKGQVLVNTFIASDVIRNGISSKGELNSEQGWATENDLRDVLPKLKNVYRYIPALTSGRKPIDFTIAILTLRMLVERNRHWGSWSEQPILSSGASCQDSAVRERLKLLADRVMTDKALKRKYSEIFAFKEKNDGDEISFSFENVVDSIPQGLDNFIKIFNLVESLPPLEHADFDVFGEVYQSIGDNATKKALGQFFTGRHVISSLLPILAKRSGLKSSNLKHLSICDPACGTGGFLTEFFRMIKNEFKPSASDLRIISQKSFYGFDLSHSNASRASVNMYFAGDGFSRIEGGYNSLESELIEDYSEFFDFVVTNPPYGKSSYGRAEEAFLKRTIDLLRPGGWGLIVLPVGVLENPRSQSVRFHLLNHCQVTDSIALPKHTFAPYTQQKTAVLIFQKREEELVSSGDIDELIDEIQDERINFFIVDNDGYANSDKRYPTKLQASDGSWLHDDLSDWVDGDGRVKPSLIYSSLILGKAIKPKSSEFGEPLGQKFGSRLFSDCFMPIHRDLSLLADTYLRSESIELSYDEFKQRTKKVVDYVNGKGDEGHLSVRSEVVELLSLPVVFGKETHYIHAKLASLFDISKGTTGFTEEVMYQNFQADGLPVFGGGKEVTNYTVKKDTKNNKGKQVSTFAGPALVVAMDGSSGSVQVVHDGEFTANHHAAVLTPYDASLNIDWVAQVVEMGLKREASNKEGSATLTMGRLEEFTLDIPIPSSKRVAVSAQRKKLLQIKKRLFS
ncbi:class I SAM-dependent DNA methyltransferase [Vibrio alginolyticus]|uniref:HsdM family class I SAM-dependent methyltransferase n=1 Tax=Vibrio alginolyticus TaxID=663 RepID=UPI0022848FD7|nr:N-6 DNA methylase [Vibrio alginolyticus]MCY9819807.1 N-6 DNA methylase [Vibrio alginolyticus]